MSAPGLRWRGDDEFELGGVEFACRPGLESPFESTADRFCICKARWAVEELSDLLSRLQPRRVIEVGLERGGSTALISGLVDLEKLVGIELRSEPIAALHELTARRGLQEAVSIHYGVDQADGGALRRIVAEEFGPDPRVDLVIDDASHMLEESRRTFDALFPLLRPGGEYLLEDWSWAHMAIPIWPRREPLTSMVFELVVACGHSPEAISRVEVNRGWALVRRGEAELDPDSFALADLAGERGHELLPAPGAGTAAAPGRQRRGWSRVLDRARTR